MKKVMFYCQHILGMGHLVRSMEIVRGLVKDFEVCFINGGEIIPGFEVPPSVEVINLPAIKTDSEFQELQVVDGTQSLEEVQESRKNQLLAVFEQFKPDCLMIELFPFGRRRFSFELIPLLEQVQLTGRSTQVVCSLRDIVVTKQNQTRHEEKVCRLMNQYFDMLLIHGDPKFVGLEESFSRVSDLNCKVHYTGYVVQPLPESRTVDEDVTITDPQKPIVLVSIGGGRFGHELLECVIETAPLLERLPHQILIFTGPFMPDEKLLQLQEMALGKTNIMIQRYTSKFLDYMKKADLSISMSGYNTTMNILTTGVRAMILPFTGNQDQEQSIRAEKLEKLGIVEVIHPADLEPDYFARKVVLCLSKKPSITTFDVSGVEKTSIYLKDLLHQGIDFLEHPQSQAPKVFVGS